MYCGREVQVQGVVQGPEGRLLRCTRGGDTVHVSEDEISVLPAISADAAVSAAIEKTHEDLGVELLMPANKERVFSL